MPTYDEWNEAIAADVCEHAIQHQVYLDTTEERIEKIGRTRLGLTSGAVDDLLVAVRTKVVDRHQRVTLGVLYSRTRGSRSSADQDAPPLCVAFLAVTVLAASKMGDRFVGNDYFSHLRDLLKCRQGNQTRPDGMDLNQSAPSPENAPEFTLWRDWGRWLARKDMVATYRLGQYDRSRFTKLPQSQILLRTVDRAKLLDIFRDGRFPPYLNESEIIRRLINEVKYGLQVTVQIEEILSDDNRRRLVTSEIKNIHEQCYNNNSRIEIISVNLQRIERVNHIRYFIQNDRLGQGSVPVTPELLKDGWEYNLEDRRQLRLRPRDVWALTQASTLDPYVSVTRTRVNQPLLLLVSKSAYEKLLGMDRLPISWDEAPPREVMPGWVERECQVGVGDWPVEWEYLAPVGGVGLMFTRRVSIDGPYRWLHGRVASVSVAMSNELRQRALGSPRVMVERLAAGGITRIGNTKRELKMQGETYSLGELDPGVWLVHAEVNTREGFPERASQRIEIITRKELRSGEREDINIIINGRRIQGLNIQDL